LVWYGTAEAVPFPFGVFFAFGVFFMFGRSSRDNWEGHDFSRADPMSTHAALAAGGHESSLNPGNAEE